MDTFTQLTVNGLTLGSVYALIALGYSLVYGILKLLNFAHGDVFMVGTFIGFGLLQLLGGPADPVVPVWLLLVLITAGAMAGCATLGVAIERFAYRPLRDAPRIAPLISALGVSFFLTYSMQLMFGAQFRDYESVLLSGGDLYYKGIRHRQRSRPDAADHHDPRVVQPDDRAVAARRRAPERARPCSPPHYDREAAAMMGIDVDRVIVFAFVLGSALAGAAGVIFALRVPTTVTIGFLAGLKGFTAAVIGGIGSIPGAMAGGLLLGFAEAYTQGYITTRWSDLFVFVAPHPAPALPAAGAPRQGRHQEGVMSDPFDPDQDLTRPLEGAAEASAAEGETSPAVGRDEWVARHGERQRRADRLARRSQNGGSAPRRGGRGWCSSSLCSRCCRSASRAATCAASPSTRSSTCCSRSASTSSWGGAVCSTSATSRSSASARTRTPTWRSDKFDVHLPTILIVPAIALFAALLGFLVALPSQAAGG